MSDHVDVRVKEGGAFYAGVETCGSVWVCPVCAAKVAEGRRAEVERVFDAHLAAGGTVWLATLTIRHNAGQSLAALKVGVAETWRKTLSGAPWMRWRDRLGLHYIRGFEVTHGANGWHPHLHVAFLVKPGGVDRDMSEFGAWLYRRWARRVFNAGYGECDPQAFGFERAEKVKRAGDYVAKWGADDELTKGHVKLAVGGGATPWELLARAGRGDKRAAWLFREYAAAMKGARQLTWSLGLRDLYDLPDASDEAIASSVSGSELLGMIPRRVFRELVARRLTVAVLEVAEDGGWSAVVALLARMGVGDGAPPDAGRSRQADRRNPFRDRAAKAAVVGATSGAVAAGAVRVAG